MIKVLLSAYACEPGKGSEPGLGWDWVRHLSRDNSLWVVTRANNREAIERASHELPRPVNFVYVDLPKAARFWKKGARGVNLYYLLWQICAWNRCRRLVTAEKIDVAHHVTLMSVTRPSFVPLLGLPSIIGPVGGLQRCPSGAKSFIRHKFREGLRDLSISSLHLNPLFRFSTARATKLVLATRSGAEFLPSPLKKDGVRFFQIGANIPETIEPTIRPKWLKRRFIVLWSARLEDHKGLEILVRAVALLKEKGHPIIQDIQVILTGKGPEKDYSMNLIHRLELDDLFYFAGWLSRSDYENLWSSVDVFTFTSLRETTGVALQEAMFRGKPSIVIANGGPGEMVTHETGILVNPAQRGQMIADFSEAIIALYNNPPLRLAMGEKAKVRASQEYTWDKICTTTSRLYREAITEHAFQSHE